MKGKADDFAVDGDCEFRPDAAVFNDAVKEPGAAQVSFAEDVCKGGATHIDVSSATAE